MASVVIGKILTLQKHPNADRLSVVRVDIQDELKDVVCGGVNLREGMLVAFAKVGAFVKWHGEGDCIELTEATIRGVKSDGMICASSEIDLDVPCGDMEVTDLTGIVKEEDIGKDIFSILKKVTT